MARSLSELQKQYNSSSKPGAPGRGPGMGGGPRGRGPAGMGGKPKNLKKTVGRLLSYVGKYKVLLVVVFIFMMLNTVTSLVGGYLTRPIVNRLTEYVGLEVDAESLSSPIYQALDGAIVSLKDGAVDLIGSMVGDGFNPTATAVMFYISAALIIL
ncbi:MAG: hypothetical protein IKJ24_06815, partial [Clostridia bacterium]|nr:hypothetical protein [Clostridia bacterium]